MALPTIDPTTTEAWKKLKQHYQETKDVHLRELFSNEEARGKNLSIHWEDFLVDYSKNRITDKTIKLLLELAGEVGLTEAMKGYFDGELINQTEGRAVLHTALRAKKGTEVFVDGENIVDEVFEVKEKIKSFSEAVISGKRKGHTGKAFTDIVNIGIGGSDLGPVMVTEALKFYQNDLKTHFVSNVDGDLVHEVLKELDPETTLFPNPSLHRKP